VKVPSAPPRVDRRTPPALEAVGVFAQGWFDLGIRLGIAWPCITIPASGVLGLWAPACRTPIPPEGGESRKRAVSLARRRAQLEAMGEAVRLAGLDRSPR